MKTRFSPLNAWLNKSDLLPKFLCLEENKDGNIEGWISLDIKKPLYMASYIQAQSLYNSWDQCRNYIKESLKVISWDFDVTLDSDEAFYIREELGDPPSRCYPIYIITVGSEDDERIVYIGKTSSNINRFYSGHKAALKLHNPKYNNLEKNIYMATIVFWSSIEEKYLPLEWIQPKETALSILDSVESELIYNFQPELNVAKKNKNYCKYPMNFHIQNCTEESNFLNDKFIQNY